MENDEIGTVINIENSIEIISRHLQIKSQPIKR